GDRSDIAAPSPQFVEQRALVTLFNLVGTVRRRSPSQEYAHFSRFFIGDSQSTYRQPQKAAFPPGLTQNTTRRQAVRQLARDRLPECWRSSEMSRFSG